MANELIARFLVGLAVGLFILGPFATELRYTLQDRRTRRRKQREYQRFIIEHRWQMADYEATRAAMAYARSRRPSTIRVSCSPAVRVYNVRIMVDQDLDPIVVDAMTRNLHANC